MTTRGSESSAFKSQVINWPKRFTATTVSQDIGRAAEAGASSTEIRTVGSEITGEEICPLVRSEFSPVDGVESTLSDGLGGSLTEAPETACSTGDDEESEAVLQIELSDALRPRTASVPGEGVMYVVGLLALGLRRVRCFEPAVTRLTPAKGTIPRE
jgi:hypothetical protein